MTTVQIRHFQLIGLVGIKVSMAVEGEYPAGNEHPILSWELWRYPGWSI